MLEAREAQMTFTIFLICGCYLVFVMPIGLVNIFDAGGTIPTVSDKMAVKSLKNRKIDFRFT